MEENNKEKMFTEKEVMDIIDKVQKDCAAQSQKYINAINDLNGTLSRLNFLLKIVSIKDVFSTEFIAKCVSEIETIVNIPDEEPSKEEE